MRAPGFVYVMVSATRPGLVKVGKTTSPPADCTNGSGPPEEKLQLRDAAYFSNYDAAESFVHDYLESYQVNGNPEYFQVPVETALQALSLATERLVGTRTAQTPATGNLYESVPQTTGGLSGPELTRKAHEFRNHRDFESAIRYYTRAASQRDPSAYIALADMAENGEGCPASQSRAVEWLEEGARNGARECSGILADGLRKHPDSALPKLRAYFDGIDLGGLDTESLNLAVIRLRFYLQFCRGRLVPDDQRIVPLVLDSLNGHPAQRELLALWRATTPRAAGSPTLIVAIIIGFILVIALFLIPALRQSMSRPVEPAPAAPATETTPTGDPAKPDDPARKASKPSRPASTRKPPAATKTEEPATPAPVAPPPVTAAPPSASWTTKAPPPAAPEPVQKTELSAGQLKDHFEVNRSRADASFRNETVRLTDTVTRIGKHDLSLGKVKCKFDGAPPPRIEPGMSIAVEGIVKGKGFITGTITVEHCRVVPQ